MTIYDYISEQFKTNPESPAIVFGNATLKYRDLEKQVEKFSSFLHNAGVGKGDIVCLSVNRSIEMITAMLSIIRVGAVYIPLDPSFPFGRIRDIVEDSQSKYLITEESLRSFFSYFTGLVLTLEEYKSHKEKVFQYEEVDEKNIAYILYTSGSTGKPKGVRVTHKNLVNFINSMKEIPGMTSGDSLLAITTISFDISGLEIYLPLVSGASIMLASREETVDGKVLLDKLKNGISIMQATPSTWKLLLESGWNEKLKLKALCGGDTLSRDLADKILERVDSLWNMYGPTETTIWSSCAKIESNDGLIHLGRPIKNTQFYIVDKNNHFCAPGVPGELLIGGDGVAAGYLNREELNREKFIPNPFDKEKKSIVYRTGDLVRITPKKELEFLGRIDNQVKIRGFRIELGEIENAIRKSEIVKDVTVITKDDGNGDYKLIAFCIPESAGILSESADSINDRTTHIKSMLKNNLPDYMLPSVITFISEFPLTPNGKIDRKELEKISLKDYNNQRTVIAPQNKNEELLVNLWKKLLSVDTVSTDDNFFDMGGHSILAAQLFADIEKETGKQLPLALLFKHQTISEIASLLELDESRKNWSPLVLIKPGNNKPALFLVHGAEGNILLYRDLANHLDKDMPVYGLQSRGLNGAGIFDTSIEKMASDYIDVIKEVQPTGPYNLGGYCMGGTIAYEIAKQLVANNNIVNMLFLIETYNVCFGEVTNSFVDRTKEKIENIKFHFDNLMSLKGSDKKTFLKQKAETAIRRTAARIGYLPAKLGLKVDDDTEASIKTISVREVNDNAQINYRPDPYNGKAVLLKPSNSFSSEPDPNFGWGELIKGDFKVYNLNLAPRGMLVEPFVKETARIISEELES